MKRRRRRRAGYTAGYTPPHKRYRKEQKAQRKQLGIQFRWPFSRRPKVAPGVQVSTPPAAPLPQTRRLPAPSAHTGMAALLTLGILSLGSVGFLLWALLGSDQSVLISLNNNGIYHTIRTKAQTVGELLEANGIVPRESDQINYALTSEVQAGMEIVIDSAFPVAVSSGGNTTLLSMHGGTVGQALAEAGVTYTAEDELTRLIYEDVAPGMQIRHIQVQTEYETVDQVIPYKENEIKDSSRYEGNDTVSVEGEDGERRVVRRLVYKDGELSTREIMNQIILKEAVDEVKIVGTRFRAQTKYSGDTRAYKAAPKESEIESTMVVQEITAYTHTGNRTATGKRTQIGYVAVNPNVIPYGTKLYIPGYGYCSAQDTGAFRHEQDGQKNQIDVFLNTAKECRSWGRKRNITVYILK